MTKRFATNLIGPERVFAIGNFDNMRQAFESKGNAVNFGATINALVAVVIPGHHEHDDRFDLRESIDDAACTEFRCARRPDSARVKQQRGKPPRFLGCSAGTPRPDPHASRRAAASRLWHGATSSSRSAQVIWRAGNRLGVSDDGYICGYGNCRQQMLRVVDSRSREPGRFGHGLRNSTPFRTRWLSRWRSSPQTADQNPARLSTVHCHSSL